MSPHCFICVGRCYCPDQHKPKELLTMTTEKREPATKPCEAWCGAEMGDHDPHPDMDECNADADDDHHRCSPACARERRRVGDGPAERPAPPSVKCQATVACDRPVLPGGSLCRFHEEKAALAKMGAPAEPAKPTKVEAGQQWGTTAFTYVVEADDGDGRFTVQCSDEPSGKRHWTAQVILADTYLGMAQAAPVEGPAPALKNACEWCGKAIAAPAVLCSAACGAAQRDATRAAASRVAAPSVQCRAHSC